MKDASHYTPADCFEIFPFPAGVLEHVAEHCTNDDCQLTTLETAGREYYEFRAALMVRNNEGLTKTYNRFHDPDETSPDILKLRELHAAMDRAVLEAYGWHDLAETATCEFLLDYEDDEDEEELAQSAPAGEAGRSPGVTAGPTTSATKSSPACWPSTRSAPNKNGWRVSRNSRGRHLNPMGSTASRHGRGRGRSSRQAS